MRSYCAFFLLFSGALFSVLGKPILQLQEDGTFQQHGLSVLVFNNAYPIGHQGGIEIIQHDRRVATNGNVWLEPTPGQWDAVAENSDPVLDISKNCITVAGEHKEAEIKYTLRVEAQNSQIQIRLDLNGPLPEAWNGKAGFQMELFPGLLFGQSWHMDGQSGIFPCQANGPVTRYGESVVPQPLAEGKMLTIASENPECRMTIECPNGSLQLIDGRIPDDNGWFVVRSLIPFNRSKNAVSWIICPHVIEGWLSQPKILHSQVGYHPNQSKRILFELDKNDPGETLAVLTRVNPDGTETIVRSDLPVLWGNYLRYQYRVLDITDIIQTGIYRVQYGAETSSLFRIHPKVYQRDVWQPTLETFFPVQMCHMRVRDRFRIWHDACHMDDALQAPVDHQHFDGYRQGSTADTPFDPGEHIPGLNQGGWHDAGDYDLAAGSQINTVMMLALIREQFYVNTDQTLIDHKRRMVVMHQPDGMPDIVQQIKQGVLQILSGFQAAGHCFPGIIAATITQYVHLGESAAMTDNRIFTGGALKKLPGWLPGTMDDRWVFTNRSTALNFAAARALAAASRVLRVVDDSLATVCLETALQTWAEEVTREPVEHRSAYVPRNYQAEEILATIELFLTTQDKAFLLHLKDRIPIIEEQIKYVGWSLCRLLPFIEDQDLHKRICQFILQLPDPDLTDSPFGVTGRFYIWGVAWQIQQQAVGQYFLHQAFPDRFSVDFIYNAVHYVLGCHPASSTSLVSGVGSHSLTTAYGVNRADWSYIPGGSVSGPALIRPDFPELKEPWPFLWQQTEYVMGGAASYIFCVLAADQLLNM
ncbi:glycoside hydrolase family 9 protein [bacterium]|nr:glycoside hydrolase family 9 protein [bacterium]